MSCRAYNPLVHYRTKFGWTLKNAEERGNMKESRPLIAVSSAFISVFPRPKKNCPVANLVDGLSEGKEKCLHDFAR
jgi:hypothetical protein